MLNRLFRVAMGILAALVAVGLLFWVKDALWPARAEVTCQPTGDSVTCSVAHRSGGTLDVCWRFAMTCANGTVVSGDACQPVEPQQTATRVLLASQLHGLERCDRAVSAAVDSMRLTER